MIHWSFFFWDKTKAIKKYGSCLSLENQLWDSDQGRDAEIFGDVMYREKCSQAANVTVLQAKTDENKSPSVSKVQADRLVTAVAAL